MKISVQCELISRLSRCEKKIESLRPKQYLGPADLTCCQCLSKYPRNFSNSHRQRRFIITRKTFKDWAFVQFMVQRVKSWEIFTAKPEIVGFLSRTKLIVHHINGNNVVKLKFVKSKF